MVQKTFNKQMMLCWIVPWTTQQTSPWSLEEVFDRWLIVHWVWLPRFQILICVIFICRGHCKIQFMWTFHISLCENWKTVCKEKLPLFQEWFYCVLRNILSSMCEACMVARDQHCETLLWNVLSCRVGVIWDIHLWQKYVSCVIKPPQQWCAEIRD